MGEVYRAYDSETDRVVALKLLPARLSGNPEYAARFRRECRSAAQLNEAHVVPIHRFGEIEGRLYLDMRLVEGTNLYTWLREHGPMTPAAAVAVVSQLALALDAAHECGLVHRDVTPSNVLLAGLHHPPLDPSTVFVYLFDFGIARPRAGAAGAQSAVLTRAGVVPGSPSYVAPERFAGVEGDPRADVYSLACLLYETLTARPPFSGDLPTLIGAHMRNPPPQPSVVNPAVPEGLNDVVATGMAKAPEQRYPSAGRLASAARAVLGLAPPQRSAGPEPVPATAPTILRKPAPRESTPAETVVEDGITVRFGPGISSSPPPGWSQDRQQTPQRPRRRNLMRQTLFSALTTGLVVAGILYYLANHHTPRLQVLGASVAAAGGPTQSCNATVDVVGTIQTNGGDGVISYRWSRSDADETDTLTQNVSSGTPVKKVHLLWKISGSGNYLATATLRILGPNPAQATGSFTYKCN
jgi:serine/threonine-protein kinase